MSENKLRLSPRLILQLLIVLVLIPLLPLLLSWRWDWWQAWVYAGIHFFGFIISRALAARAHPDLLRERAKFADHQDAKDWDQVLARLMGIGSGLVPLAVGLEHRFGGAASYGLGVELVGLALVLAGFALGTWALVANRYFSGMVRIQYDRGHRVVYQGPYQIIRHPGYLGALITYLGTPLLLEGRWAFLTVFLLTGVTLVRTALEDDTLQEELDGYQDYAETVRSRLIPGVW
jgi:protein-S-isoprenylcysteine O-methyltransferase Ste14